MDRLKVAHTIKSRCMAVRMLEGLLTGMPPEQQAEIMDSLPLCLQIPNYREYTHRAMHIAERLIKCG
jgi:hypothetical protein